MSTLRARYPRTACCVPFCRRTSTLFPKEWLCADHWRLVERRLKRFRTKRLNQLRGRWQKAYAEEPQSKRATMARQAYWRAEALIWERMKRQAISRAAGAPI